MTNLRYHWYSYVGKEFLDIKYDVV